MNTLTEEKKKKIKHENTEEEHKKHMAEVESFFTAHFPIQQDGTQPPLPPDPPPGTLLEQFNIPLPYRVGSAPMNVQALADGTVSPFCAETSSSNTHSGELNLSVVAGKWFAINYHCADGGNAVTRDFAYFSNRHVLRHYEEDVKVRVITAAHFVPTALEQMVYVDRGNENVDQASVNLTLKSSGSSFNPLGTADHQGGSDMVLLNIVKERGREDIVYQAQGRINSYYEFIQPAWNPDVIFDSFLYGKASISNNNRLHPVDPNDTGQYAVALLDLRSIQSGSSHPILRDPIGAWDKQPFGGIQITISVQVFSL